MLDSIYHMRIKLFCHRVFRVKTSGFCQIYATLLLTSFHNITKVSKLPVFFDFNTWRYITPRRDEI